MPERAYTISEIDRMREALRWILTPLNRCYFAEDVERQIEGQLRTYMAAGIEPEELHRRAGNHISQQANFR